MIKILADRNVEGQAQSLYGILAADGWVELCAIRFFTFADAGLSFEADDREVWRFAQKNGMILLTDNRNMKGKESLEQTIREENTETSLPILTIGNVKRMSEKLYRERCAARLLEIILDLKNWLGSGRIFIP